MENGIRYLVDFENGQKTGFFLDQKYNRQAVARLSRGKRVLDCFTHTGSFGLNAAMGGAQSVHCVDVSEAAVEMARSNARRNGLENRMTFEAANVFDLLPTLAGHPYDLIILDPPSFTRNKKSVHDAMRGYKEIHLRAMKLLAPGGILSTFCCSHHAGADLFRESVLDAAIDAPATLRLIQQHGQRPDHPILLNIPETEYLKGFTYELLPGR